MGGFSCQNDFIFLQEYIPGGDVKNLLEHFGVASEEEARFYVAEMLLAVADLHSLGYIHRYFLDQSHSKALANEQLTSFAM